MNIDRLAERERYLYLKGYGEGFFHGLLITVCAGAVLVLGYQVLIR